VNKWYCLTHYHDDQILTSRLWAYSHIKSVTWLITIVKKLRRFWYFKKKEVLNFNLVSEIQPKKTKIQNYLFVLKSSCEHISRKKREVPKTRFKTISCSLLASKLQFGEHPQLRIWAGQNYPHALRNNVSKRRFKKPLKLLICFNTSCVKLLRLRLTSKQPKPSSVFSYI